MGVRRKSREHALRILYGMDFQQNLTPSDILPLYFDIYHPAQKLRSYISDLVYGVNRFKKQIDELIERYSTNWKLNRMACVDRNILRIGIYEMLFRKDIPAKVSINEAVEIGKIYGTSDSGAFINGILDKIHVSEVQKRNKIQPEIESNQPNKTEGDNP